MSQQPAVSADSNIHIIQQAVKWTVYTLLIINLEYTNITDETCGELSGESQFYWLAQDPVVSDMAGLSLKRDLAWVDLIEVVVGCKSCLRSRLLCDCKAGA